MYIIYIDESGDTGMSNSPSNYFALSGLVVHELCWRNCLNELIYFRRQMRNQFGLKLREEFHTCNLLFRPRALSRIDKYNRLTMIRLYAKMLASIADLSVINILVNKTGKSQTYDVFEHAWEALFQRFENTIAYNNFPGGAGVNNRGLIICDHTQEKKLESLLRKMRKYNPIPNLPKFGAGSRNIPINYLIEDPIHRNSSHSYFIQSVDLVAYLLYQYNSPNVYMKKKSAMNYFTLLDPILCKTASRTDPLGIVRL